MLRRRLLYILIFLPLYVLAQINTTRVMTIGRNALYFEDYVLSIQYFNQVINAKPYLHEPYFFRGLAKLNLEDYSGAESDCTESIERNPFVVSSYQVRGLARIHLGNFEGAINDYNQALAYDPENIGVWHNLILCRMREKDYEKAQEAISRLMKVSPRYVPAFLMRSEVSLKQGDTIQAMADVEEALALDKYDADIWATRAMLHLQLQEYKDAEADLDQAIYLMPKRAGYHINRALARFHQNNLRGAMSDYDMAIDAEPGNIIGHYNRGLLRAQVGDDNRAIEDFDKVIQAEPDNMMAVFNRGLLREQTGDYRGAIEDFSAVLEEYPEFLVGYQYRAMAKRKMGDRRGADADEFVVTKAEIDRRNKLLAGDSSSQEESEEDKEKTRKRSNRNMKNYRKIVVADNADMEQKYKNEYRGRVQDRNVKVELEPMFALTYYQKTSEVDRALAYHKTIDLLNHEGYMLKRVYLTNKETALNQEQIEEHFASIDNYSASIADHPQKAEYRFARALDFYLVQDLSSALEDLTQSLLCDDEFVPAYFNRALIRCKQLEYKRAEDNAKMEEMQEGKLLLSKTPLPQTKAIDYQMVKADLDKVISLAPDFEYAYYNRANMLCQQNDYHAAMVDYDKSIEINPQFAEAYYNRGLTHIFMGQVKEGVADLSKAGELGLYKAYNIIKRYTDREE